MKALKFWLMASCVLGLELGSALGQGIESCSQCICVADGSCAVVEGICDATSTLDCRTTTFYAACGVAYSLRAVLTCDGGDSYCKYCYACVRLTGPGIVGEATIHTSCQAFDCDETWGTVSLQSGERYTLTTCLRRCDEGSCEECDCVARGYVYIYSSNCNTIPACNP